LGWWTEKGSARGKKFNLGDAKNLLAGKKRGGFVVFSEIVIAERNEGKD